MIAEHLPYRPCAGIVVINPDGLIFAAKRLDFQSDAWQMPQGGIDEGETPRDAALRELGEETGIVPSSAEILAETPYWLRYDLPIDMIGKIWGGKYRGQRQKWFAFKFLGDEQEINIAQEHPEFSEWKWMRAQDVIDSIVEFKRPIYEKVLGEFAEFLR